jgi:hypothetical protein
MREEIIEACYLSEDDPVIKWKQVQAEIEEIKNKLDDLHEPRELVEKAPSNEERKPVNKTKLFQLQKISVDHYMVGTLPTPIGTDISTWT